MQEMHEANRRHWDAAASGWRQLRDRDQLWRQCPAQPALAFDGMALEMIHQFAGELVGKQVCVIGSGDNCAAFALAGMGAAVTSVDISERQLEVAAQRAQELGLQITFVRSDAAGLKPIQDGAFDLVCSTNGFFVWIAQPAVVFSAVHRILKAGGYYIFYDIHPFMRPWKDQITPIEMVKPYSETGPFESVEAGQPVYEFGWTLSDFVNPLLETGLQLRKMAES
ncbi:MAG TPA: class I SAM-dependent methyltransferase, partial [Anaerolineae bacterium]